MKSEERANEVLRNQSSLPFSTFSLTKEVGDEPEKFLEDDFQTAIEKSKNASTMEELFKS